MHGVPESITTDNGPPYNSREWRRYGKEVGFRPIHTSAEHPKSNGIAERFMGVLSKVIKFSIAEGKDPRLEVQRRLLNYRNTPHPSTGHSPAKLMLGRKIWTKLPAVNLTKQTPDIKQARQ